MPAALSQIITEQAKHLLATGETQTATAEQLNISRRSANIIAKDFKEEITDLAFGMVSDSLDLIRYDNKATQQLSNQIISYITGIKDSTTWHRFKGLSKRLKVLNLSAKDLLNVSDRKQARILELTGIKDPRTSGDTYIDRVLVVNDKGSIEQVPRIQELIGLRQDQDIIDIEPE